MGSLFGEAVAVEHEIAAGVQHYLYRQVRLEVVVGLPGVRGGCWLTTRRRAAGRGALDGERGPQRLLLPEHAHAAEGAQRERFLVSAWIVNG